jgi:uncharacterized protein (TIGR03083 family)
MESTLNREALAGEISSARDSLVSDLAALSAESWESPSLCAGWVVRDVVGHLIRLHDYLRSPVRYAASITRHGLRPNRFQVVDASRYAAGRHPESLVRSLREAEYTRTWVWRQHPSPDMTLAELVIHAQDIRRPLGVAADVPIPQLRLVADLIVRRVPRPLRYPLGGWRLPDARFQATDDEWSWGSGPMISGPLESIVMVLAGRVDGKRQLGGDLSGLTQ